MKSRLLTALTVTTVLAAPTPALAQGAAPAPGCHGIQVTDKTGDNTSTTTNQTGSPSSDLVAGWITYDGSKAFANIQVDNLTEGEIDPPFVAIGWEFMMTTSAGPRFVRAYHDVLGMTKYTWGEPRAITDDQTQPRVSGATTGALFPGKNGVIQIEIPVAEADFGAKPGTQLKALALEVRQWLSVPAAVPSTGLPIFSVAPIFDDAAGKGAFTLGPCGATPAAGAPGGPPAPTPVSPTRTDSGEAELGVKVTFPKLSAKKLRKARRFTVKLSGKATSLTAAVRKSATGGANLATGKLAKLDGTGRLTMKIRRKLKKGTYVLVVSGKNAEGRAAGGGVKFRVR